MEFDTSGALIGGKEAMQYEEAVLRLAEDVPEVKGKKSSSPGQMRWQYVKYNNGGYRDAAWMAILSALSVILYFVIYGWRRRSSLNRERREREEKEKRLCQL